MENETGNEQYPIRARNTTDRFSFHAAVMQDEEETIAQALGRVHVSDWKFAIDAEIKALQENRTWKAQVPPHDAAVIDPKYMLSINKDRVLAFEARLVFKGFLWENGYRPVSVDVMTRREIP